MLILAHNMLYISRHRVFSLAVTQSIQYPFSSYLIQLEPPLPAFIPRTQEVISSRLAGKGDIHACLLYNGQHGCISDEYCSWHFLSMNEQIATKRG